MSKGAADIAAERQRQINAEGYTLAHDDTHTGGELAMAAACYAVETLLPDEARTSLTFPPDDWPFAPRFWKSTTRRRNLVKAGALIAAEIDRIDRRDGGQG